MNVDMSEISQRMAEEIACYRRLMEILEEERQILLGGDHQGLQSTAERKLALARELAELQDQRRQAMARLAPAGGPPPRLGDLAGLLPSAERGPFKTMLGKAQGLAQRLRQLSQNNKAFVEEALDTVEHLLGILANGARPRGYDASGALASHRNPGPARMVVREV